MSRGLQLLSQQLIEAEQQCALALAKAQQDLKLFIEQQNALNEYRQVYHQQWTERGLQGISPQQNTQYHAFINKLEQAATQQSEGVLQARRALALRCEECLAAQQRRKAVDLLLKKQAIREQEKALRQEQKMLDEYTMLRGSHQTGV